MDFQSKFAPQMELFIKQKRGLGFSYSGGERILRQFDMFCVESFPNESILTREICNLWSIHRDTESKGGKGYVNRLSVIREFARFLLRSGTEAFVIPVEYGTFKKGAAIPHIFTDDELKLIFRASDSLERSKVYKTSHIAAPVMFRLIFACGLRPQEVRVIKNRDIDLETGVIKIVESKSRKDRLVVMDESMRIRCIGYSKRMHLVFPKADYFFPSECDTGFYGADWLSRTFNRCLRKSGLAELAGNKLRVYDFRHSFATKTLYRWLMENRDLNNCLPYLSAYMGHENYSDTAYYIHLVPEFFSQKSNIDFNRFSNLLPEVENEN